MSRSGPTSVHLRPRLAAGALVVPSVALAHGPPAPLFWSMLLWIALALFVLWGGTATAASAARQARSGKPRNARFVLFLGLGVGLLGVALAIALFVQGPWSTWPGIVVAALAVSVLLVALRASTDVRNGP